MFIVLGFSVEQMGRLCEEFVIYGVVDGRINIVGLIEKDIFYVVNVIIYVL